MKVFQIKKNKKRRTGLTMVELAIVMLVLGILMTVLYANLDIGGAKDSANRFAIKNTATQLEVTLERYEFSNEPLQDGDSLMLLAEKNSNNPGWKPVKESLVMDPWKHAYFICTDDTGSRQICTYGADGQPGGEGKNQDFYLTDSSSWPAWLSGKGEE